MTHFARTVIGIICTSCLLPLASCGDSDYEQFIENLKNESVQVRRAAIYDLHDRGKEAIPELIA